MVGLARDERVEMTIGGRDHADIDLDEPRAPEPPELAFLQDPKNRAEAIKLIEFLTSPEAQQMFADSNFEYPANPQAGVNPLIAGWGKFKQDDTNIAAAGEFQAAATKLADRAGYK